jgi:hypothetical protein
LYSNEINATFGAVEDGSSTVAFELYVDIAWISWFRFIFPHIATLTPEIEQKHKML